MTLEGVLPWEWVVKGEEVAILGAGVEGAGVEGAGEEGAGEEGAGK